MCVCTYVYTDTCIHIHMCIHIIYVCIHIHLYIYVCIYIIYICIYVYIHMYIYAHTYKWWALSSELRASIPPLSRSVICKTWCHDQKNMYMDKEWVWSCRHTCPSVCYAPTFVTYDDPQKKEHMHMYVKDARWAVDLCFNSRIHRNRERYGFRR